MPVDDKALCCVATRNYCSRLAVAYCGVLEFNDIPLFVLVVDIEPAEKEAAAEALRRCLPARARDWIHVVGLEDVYPGAVESMRFYYDAFELCTAGKAGLHDWMYRTTLVEKWLYIDSDVLCFGSLDPVLDCLAEPFGILLTPHRCTDGNGDVDDLLFLAAGCFNSGVVGVRRTAESGRFTRWYRKTLAHLSLNDVELEPASRFTRDAVLFGDQRWLDLVPGYFEGVFVGRRRGFNLGHWNIGGDHLRRVKGALYAGDERVILLHLSGWSPDDPSRFCRHSEHDFTGDAAWTEIYTAYCDQLEALNGRFPSDYRYANYPDGTPVPKPHRRAYLRYLLDGGPTLGSPFAMKHRFEPMASAAAKLIWDRRFTLSNGAR
ncbi:MAG: hypothetical protein GZ089_13700 [Aromatoleum sp.]|nr:hypothetical protein [Aromatoleum sp.]